MPTPPLRKRERWELVAHLVAGGFSVIVGAAVMLAALADADWALLGLANVCYILGLVWMLWAVREALRD